MRRVQRIAVAFIAFVLIIAAIGATNGAGVMPKKSSSQPSFCSSMKQVDKASLAAFDSLTGDAEDAELNAALLKSAQAYVAQAAQLERLAPEGIRKDLKVVLDAYRALVAGRPDALEAQAYHDAQHRMELWLEQNCGMVMTDPEE